MIKVELLPVAVIRMLPADVDAFTSRVRGEGSGQVDNEHTLRSFLWIP